MHLPGNGAPLIHTEPFTDILPFTFYRHSALFSHKQDICAWTFYATLCGLESVLGCPRPPRVLE